jgi:hypothetical protein
LKIISFNYQLSIGHTMASNPEIQSLISRLASAPGRYTAALSRLEDADSVTGAQPGEWSPAEVLAHVRASHAILEPRIVHILVRDNPPLPAFDERRWQEVALYHTVAVIDSLEALRLRRNELVRVLRSIPEADWQRTGLHETNGPQTILQIATHIANHDDEHIAQIERLKIEN